MAGFDSPDSRALTVGQGELVATLLLEYHKGRLADTAEWGVLPPSFEGGAERGGKSLY